MERPSLRTSFRTFARNWWYVLVWLGVIRLESTDAASANHTSRIVYVVVATVYPKVQPTFIEQLNEVLRKSGHFLGYGILSVLVFLALRNTNRDRLRGWLQRPWGAHLRDWWRAQWVAIGLLMTVMTASFDEIHQTFIPSRTGKWQDVVLDTVGAMVLQVLVYFVSMRGLHRRQGDAMNERE